MSAKPVRRLGLDWFLVQLRWLLFAVAFLLALLPDSKPSPAISIIAVLALAYNVALTALALWRITVPRLAAASVLIDILIIASLAWVTQAATGPLPLLLLVPALIASLRYEWFGGIASALLVGLLWIAIWLSRDGGTPTANEVALAAGSLGLLLCVMVGGVGLGRIEHARAREMERQAQDRIRLAEEQIQAIYELTGTLSATLNYDRVLDSILDVALLGLQEIGEQQGQIACMILLFEDASSSRRLQIAACRHLSEREAGRVLEAEEGLLGALISTVEPQAIADPDQDPELRAFPSLRGFRSAVAIPLRAGFELFGTLVFASARPKAYQAEQMMFLSTLSNQAAIALQNARYYQRLEEEKNRIIDGEAEVRHWLARELHDGPTQTISALAMRLNYVQFILDREPDKVAGEIRDLEKMARRATREIRATLFKLRPLALESQGLRAALEQYAAKLREDEGINLQLDIEEPSQRLDGKVESTVFSIIEEAVNNARKHSGAESIAIRAAAYEEALVITVRDNGKGFDLKNVQGSYDQRGSFGLVNMKERAELLGGTLEIESRPGSGTVVTLIVPLRGAASP